MEAQPPVQNLYPHLPPPGQNYPPQQAQQLPPLPPPGPNDSMMSQGQSMAPPQQTMQPLMMATPGVVLDKFPTVVTCQFCGKSGITNVRYETAGGTYLACAGLLLIQCWCGCCLIPFCLDDCKDFVHFCSSCNNVVGRKKFLLA
eukprot:TRINITY_DN2181_c0_g2_i7.p1 TRINITY_DN2181_c0_g2~~TRINITY_DN2181_c0_g2_i7.p1  ORF type:complete len:144 (-),score=28.61 TRINITY_DN2181_c0_g2_i7:115-546(-)